jgi:class 3 adenylate cyclase
VPIRQWRALGFLRRPEVKQQEFARRGAERSDSALQAQNPSAMSDLPTGTVTFLLTDVEGSTRLWEESPEAMRAALVRHDALAVERMQTHQGVLMKPRGEGDSLFIVFARASDAVAATCDLGDLAKAEALFQESMALTPEIGDRANEPDCLSGLGVIAQRRGDRDLARAPYGRQLRIRSELGDRRMIATGLELLAGLAAERASDGGPAGAAAAARLWGAAAAGPREHWGTDGPQETRGSRAQGIRRAGGAGT